MVLPPRVEGRKLAISWEIVKDERGRDEQKGEIPIGKIRPSARIPDRRVIQFLPDRE